MITSGMTLQEKQAHVRGEVDRVLRKYEKVVAAERHALKASRDKLPRLHQSDYRSPSRIDWVVTVRITKKNEKVFMSAWWQVEGAGLEAISLSPKSAFYFDTHFLQRYRVRESEVVGAADNVKRFLRVNYDITIKLLDTQRHGLQEVAGVAAEGLFVGTKRPDDIIACDTFLSNDMLRHDQKALQHELQFHAHTKDWPQARLQQYRKWLDERLKEMGEE